MNQPLFRFSSVPNALLLDLVNLANDTHLKPGDISFGFPVAKGRTLTEIPVTPDYYSPLSGTTTVSYHRLDLNNFFFGIPITIESNEEITPEFIQRHVLGRWEVNLDPNEIEIVQNTFGDYFPKQIHIRAKSTSLVWVGEVEAWVLSPGHIGNVFRHFDFSFNDRTSKRNAFLYSIERGLSDIPQEVIDYCEIGRNFNTYDEHSHKVIRLLKDITGDPWVIEPVSRAFNLKFAKVTYHGPLHDDTVYRVIVIELRDLCNNLYGNLVLNYHPDQEG